MFTKASLRALGISSADVSHLTRRTIGGETGGAGYTYQRHFAAVELFKAAVEFLDTGTDAEIAQEGLCWVDDVIVRSKDTHFFQLKISKKVTWGGQRKKLTREFVRQRKLCIAAKIRHGLHLVSPHLDRVQHFNSKAPTLVKPVFSAEYFPQKRKRPELWAAGAVADPSVRRLCAVDPPSRNDRDLVATKLVTVWEDAGSPSTPQKVSAILAKAWNDAGVPIRRPNGPAPENWSDFQSAVAAVPGLSVTLNNGFVSYNFVATTGASESGPIGPSDGDAVRRFVERIRTRPPNNYFEFWREI